ncbi:MAG: ubiquinone/menaquinone biosynthesis methyltransferase [Myxococcales bacterium]|nr:ubiquinone/menaquinone biosynthesis methyltransferase [Myxococcales bacterium]MDD9970762.1 ubiquinone/menaquinone biosynthesis methyltransferase [Myxococcales bacterium]
MPDITDRAPPEVAAGHALAVQQMFDRISPTYDLLNRVMSFGVDRRWRKRALAVLASDLPPGPLLDLCAGTGDLSRALADMAPERPVVAADFSREMLGAGRAAGAFGSVPSDGGAAASVVGLTQADAMVLPFCDAAFAGAVCGFGIRNVEDPEACMREVRRVLRPGGTFVVLEFLRPTRPWTYLFHAIYGRLVLPAAGAVISGEAPAYRYLSRSMRGFMSRVECERAMVRAGFSDVRGQDLTLGIASLIWGVK